ncbi:MAG: DUF86 domain-containing protein [Pseudomonadota bacterium]
MSSRKWVFRIQHILEAIERIRLYTAGMDEAGFTGEQKTIDAVLRNFQVIGEAARHVPKEIQASHPDVPWSVMIGMRHVLVHDYDTVDTSTLWLTIQQDLPPLVPKLRRLLKAAEKE